MTDQYTPTLAALRYAYVEMRYQLVSEAGYFPPSIEERIAEYERGVAVIEAAAEQRGAIKALREAAGAIEKNQIVTQLGHLQPCNSCMVIHMDFLDYRADQIEGDDE